MKVYLSFDIEGVTGLTDNVKDIDPDGRFFHHAMELSTMDVNAAVEGAVEAGANEVIVNDGHGWNRRNLLFEKLHPQASLLRARVTTPGLNMAGLDESFHAVMFIGWHARASSRGVLSHALNSRAFTAWRINDRPVGEPELAAAYAGTYGIPLVLFTGDDAACDEVQEWCPKCVRVQTKIVIDHVSAICGSKEKTFELIKNGARSALERRSDIEPFLFDGPFRVEADLVNDHVAGAIAEIPAVSLVNRTTVRYESEDFRDIFRATHAMQMISGAAL